MENLTKKQETIFKFQNLTEKQEAIFRDFECDYKYVAELARILLLLLEDLKIDTYKQIFKELENFENINSPRLQLYKVAFPHVNQNIANDFIEHLKKHRSI